MNAHFRQVTEITLTLTPEEAMWLKLMCQNPIGGDHESVDDMLIRNAFFNHLPSVKALQDAHRNQTS